MKLYFIMLAVVASSIQSLAALAEDGAVALPGQAQPNAQSSELNNPTNKKIVGSDRTNYEPPRETGAMARTTKIKSTSHGGDSSVPIDRMPAGGPLGGSGVSTGAKIPGPDGVVNHKNEVPATKNEVTGGAVAAPGT